MLMKNKVSLMTGVVALMLAIAPLTPLFSQTANANDTPAQSGRQRMGRQERLLDRLNLSDAQKTQLRQIQQETQRQIEEVLGEERLSQIRQARQQGERPNITLSAEDQNRIRTIRQNARAQMEGVLNETQRRQFQEMQQRRQR